jgi:hypothetical protein
MSRRNSRQLRSALGKAIHSEFEHRQHHRPLRFEPLEDRRLLATLTVNSLSDVKLAGDGLVTLREAILAANTNTATDLGQTGSGADTIVFAPGLSGTIGLAAGELLITQGLTINGLGEQHLTIDAAQLSRVFNFTSTADSFTLRNLKVVNGKTTGSSQDGGAIRSLSTKTLTLDHVTVASSGTTGGSSRGGGLFATRAVDIRHSTFRDNFATGSGSYGAAFVAGNTILADSVISGNSNGTSGSVVDASETTISNSQIINNFGGALDLDLLTMTNSTVGGNTGSGIHIGNLPLEPATSTITSSTIHSNGSYGVRTDGQLTLIDCMISENQIGAISQYDMRVNSSTITKNRAAGLTTLPRGSAFIDSSTISFNQNGGLDMDFGKITLTNSLITGNVMQSGSAGGSGGGINAFNGSIHATNCTITNNTATGVGGGAFSRLAVFIDCVIANNQSQQGGGGLSVSENLQLIDSAVFGNSTEDTGGGVRIFGDASILNSTISGNRAGKNGGGVYLTNSADSLLVLQSTVVQNHSLLEGGGIWSSSAPVAIANSIVATNFADGSGTDLMILPAVILSISSSLIGDNVGSALVEAQAVDHRGNFVGSSIGVGAIDPRLAPLHDYGGSTFTHALLPDSPALDRISPAPAAAHNYPLDGSLADQLGGPSLVPVGGTTTSTGYDFAANQGLNLSNAITNGGQYSIEIVFSWDTLSGGYQKILDFHNLTGDVGLYSLVSGLNFVNGAFVPDVFVANQSVHLVLTRDDATDVLRAYIGGVEVWNLHDAAGDAVFSAPDRMMRFFQDDNTSGQAEAQAGFVDRIRIFDATLDAGQVLSLINPAAVFQFDQRGNPFSRIVDYDGVGGPRIDIGAYESQGIPVLSPFDYNRNGIADAADYTIWRDMLGQTNVTPFSGADGDGDGSITDADYFQWKSHFGEIVVNTQPPVGGGSQAKSGVAEERAAFIQAAYTPATSSLTLNEPPALAARSIGFESLEDNQLLVLLARSQKASGGVTDSHPDTRSMTVETAVDDVFSALGGRFAFAPVCASL